MNPSPARAAFAACLSARAELNRVLGRANREDTERVIHASGSAQEALDAALQHLAEPVLAALVHAAADVRNFLDPPYRTPFRSASIHRGEGREAWLRTLIDHALIRGALEAACRSRKAASLLLALDRASGFLRGEPFVLDDAQHAELSRLILVADDAVRAALGPASGPHGP